MSLTTPAFRVGDRVTPNPEAAGVPPATLGRVYVVEKVNPKNLRCRAEDGGRGISFPASLLLLAPPAGTAAVVTAVPFVAREHFVIGEVVTLKIATTRYGTDTPMVVTGGGDRVNVAKLGGLEDRYLRVDPRGLVRRDLTWLAEHLVDGLA